MSSEVPHLLSVFDASRDARGAVSHGALPTAIERLSLHEINSDVLAGLEVLYAASYHDSHMYADILEDMKLQLDIFQLFLARANGDIVGARVIESKVHSSIDYHGHAPVHGKRFSVLPEYRGRGIGARIINAANGYAFNELGLAVVFGESNEIGALSLYGRQGAMYALGSIEKALRRNSPEAAQRLFAKFITDPELRELRLPGSIPGGHDAVQFAYCRDQESEEEFRGYGFASYKELSDMRSGSLDTDPTSVRVSSSNSV